MLAIMLLPRVFAYPPERLSGHIKRTMPPAPEHPCILLKNYSLPLATLHPYHGRMNASLSFPGFSSPGVGLSTPLELLSACHTRVEKQCQTLERLQAHLPVHGSDLPAQEAATAVLRYFDTAARHHHEDEEQDLFPALLESMAGSDAVCIQDLTAGLMLEHRDLEKLWFALRLRLRDIAQGQASAQLPADEVSTFTARYRAHIAREDRDLLPMAARLLGEEALQAISQAMHDRRVT